MLRKKKSRGELRIGPGVSKLWEKACKSKKTTLLRFPNPLLEVKFFSSSTMGLVSCRDLVLKEAERPCSEEKGAFSFQKNLAAGPGRWQRVPAPAGVAQW